MLHLLPTTKVIVTTTSIIVIVIGWVTYTPQKALTEWISLALSLSTIIETSLLVIMQIGWRSIWKLFPILADKYYPDLNGIWQGKITFEDPQGELSVRARIVQDLTQITMDFSTETSESYSLVAHPRVEGGNHILYYIYRNTPKNPQYPEFKGVSILNVKSEKLSLELSGHYFTVRQTRGRVELKRKSSNPKENYRYY